MSHAIADTSYCPFLCSFGLYLAVMLIASHIKCNINVQGLHTWKLYSMHGYRQLQFFCTIGVIALLTYIYTDITSAIIRVNAKKNQQILAITQ